MRIKWHVTCLTTDHGRERSDAAPECESGAIRRQVGANGHHRVLLSRMLLYFINRGGRGLTPRRRAELERAKRIMRRMMIERRH